MMYSCYELDGQSRLFLLRTFHAKFPKNVICDHVTFSRYDHDIPPKANKIELVGYASNDMVEAYVVRVDGSTERPDGGTYHLTYSVNPNGGKPEMSNTLIEEGYEPLALAIEISAKPTIKGREMNFKISPQDFSRITKWFHNEVMDEENSGPDWMSRLTFSFTPSKAGLIRVVSDTQTKKELVL